MPVCGGTIFQKNSRSFPPAVVDFAFGANPNRKVERGKGVVSPKKELDCKKDWAAQRDPFRHRKSTISKLPKFPSLNMMDVSNLK